MKALEDKNYKKTAKYCEDMQNQFRMAQNSLQMDIEHWYQRLADNNGISYAAAKRLLKANELEEFHWTVEEYIRRGKENALNQQWMKQLENASARVHINYLQAIKLQLGQHAELLYQKYYNGVMDFLTNTYSDQFYHTAYEIAKGSGVAGNLAEMDIRRINLVLTTPWAQDGKNFSDRIWRNKDKLVRELHTELTQCIIRGENPDKAAGRLADSMSVKARQARTLIYTESAAIAMTAQKDCFEELGVEEYEIVETLDSITCGYCQDMDGKHFPLSDYQVGITAPPFHPNCRGCTCPYFNDEFTAAEKRSARNGEGDIYYVPSNMNYKEWKAKFVQEGLAAGDKELGNIPEHNKPIKLGNIDFSDKNMVLSKLEDYEKLIMDSSVENAIVISRDGNIWQCFGTLNGVYPDMDLGDTLTGAFVTHNHPINSANEYSFSDLDIQLFIQYNLSVLRGIDDRYVYELTRNVDEVDEHMDFMELIQSDGEHGRHEHVIDIAKENGIGYRRRER